MSRHAREGGSKAFLPASYVGHRGWLGVYLDIQVDWGEVAIIVERAYRRVAPKRLLAGM